MSININMLPTMGGSEYLALKEKGRDVCTARVYAYWQWLQTEKGLKGYDIERGIIVHHMNPISIEDIVNSTDRLMNPEYLICTRLKTHNAIHYGDESILREVSVIKRTKNDTCPWKR